MRLQPQYSSVQGQSVPRRSSAQPSGVWLAVRDDGISPGWVGGRWVGSIDIASVVISAAYIERVTAFETEHDSILIVHAHRVQPSQASDLSRSSRSASGMRRFGMRPV